MATQQYSTAEQEITVSVSVAEPERLDQSVWHDTFKNREFPLFLEQFQRNNTFQFNSSEGGIRLAFQAWVLAQVKEVVGDDVVDYSALINHSKPKEKIWETDNRHWYAHLLYVDEVVAQEAGTKEQPIYRYFDLSIDA